MSSAAIFFAIRSLCAAETPYSAGITQSASSFAIGNTCSASEVFGAGGTVESLYTALLYTSFKLYRSNFQCTNR